MPEAKTQPATARPPQRGQRGQSTVEFGISAVVLMLLLAGLLDLSRVFYFNVDILGAAREGARHGVWFDTPNRRNPYLDDTDVLSAVSANLKGAGFPAVTTNSSATTSACPTSTSNSYGNPPYDNSLYPPATTLNQPRVYLCYTPPNPPNSGCSLPNAPQPSLTGTPGAATNDNCWRLGDLNVAILFRYGLVTPILQNVLGNGFQVASNAHMMIQGKP